MYFESVADFIAMGRHGFYVWLAYAVFLVILVWNWIVPRLQLKRSVNAVRRERQRDISTTHRERL